MILSGNIIKENVFKMMRKICILKKKEYKTQTEFCQQLDISNMSPGFRECLNIMRLYKLIKEDNPQYREKSITIDLDKIEAFIRDNSIEFKEWGKFIEVTTPGYIY